MSPKFSFPFRPFLFVLPLFFALSGCFGPVHLTEAPEGEVSEFGSMYFEFNTAMIAEDSSSEWITEELIRFDPPISGAYQWVSPTRLKFSHSALQPCRDYTAVLLPAVLMGKTHVTDFDTIRFHTPYFDVQSVSFSWSDANTYGMEAPVEVIVRFSKEVESYEVHKYIEVWNDGRQLEDVRLNSYGTSSHINLFIDGDNLKNAEKPIEVRFKKDLPSKYEHAKLKEDRTLSSALAPPGDLEIRTAKSEINNGHLVIELEANQKIDPQLLRNYLVITPERDWGLQSRGNRIMIQGDFKPGTLVNVKVKKGAQGKRGGTLWKEFDHNLVLPDLQPFLRFADGKGRYLMRNGAENLNVKTVNVPKFITKVYEVYENNLLHFLDRNSYHFNSWNYYSNENDYYYGHGDDLNLSNFGNLIAVDTFRNEEAEQNEILNVPVNLQKQLRTKFQGIFAMELFEDDEYWSNDSKIISLSDLGLIARKSKDELLVFVNTLSTASPVAGATVKVISSTNQTILSGSTNGSGVVRFGDLKEKLKTGQVSWEPRLIVVSYGADFNFLDLKHSEIHDGRWELPGKRPSQNEVFLYSQRNLYRPGDTAHFAAIVRTWDMEPEANTPFLFRVYSQNGDLITEKKKVTDAQGGFEISLPMGLDERTGSYNAEVLNVNEDVLQSYRFNVEEFVPDKIKVRLIAGQRQGRPGDSLRFPLSGAYYFGSNCSDHKYEYRIRFQKQNFYSRKFREFHFRPVDRNQMTLDGLEGQGKLDLTGNDTLLFNVPKDLKAMGPVTGQVYATVFDNTGHTVSSRTSFDLITQENYLGVKSAGRYFSVNDNFEMQVVAVNNEDALTPGFPIVIEVHRADWKQAMRKRAGGFAYVSEREPILVRRDTIRQGSKPHRYQMRIRKAGNYTVTVKAAEGGILENELEFSAYGREVATASSFGVNREGSISILTDRDNYNTGQNARLLFTAPFSGRMLVTIERDEVYEYRYLNVENNSAELVLPLSNKLVPNVVVSATLFRPQRTMGALPMTVAHGFTSLKVDNPNLELPIRIEAPERIKPGGTTSIAVRTAPLRDVRVTVAIVDEGILAIKNYKTPNPFAFMYAAREATVEGFDMYKDLLPEVPSAQGATGGGDGPGGSSRMRNPIQARRYRPVAVWSGILRSDASGRVRTELTIPKEFNGQARIMAVAWHNDRFGAGDAPIVVKDDVVMMPGVPRFATAGDTLVIPVNLLNTTTQSGQARVTVQSTGPLKVLGKNSLELGLEPEGSASGSFRIVASNAIGVATLNFKLSGMETAEHDLELAVRPPSPLETESGSGAISAGETATLKIPGGYYPQLHEARLRISNLPAMKFADHLEYLLRYPHGCAEQTTSAVFPQLYFAELAEIIAPDLYKNSNAVHHVREGIRKLESMQRYDGGFSYWPGNGYANRWASVYVTHFLLEARAAGFSVNNSTLENAVRHIGEFAAAKATFTYVYYRDSRRYEVIKAEKETIYGLYVLALAEKADLPLMNYYKNHLEQLTGDSRYLLAAAFALTGDMASFESLLPGAWEPEEAERLTGRSFDSPVRSNAVMLNALVDADPNHPFVEQLVSWLSENSDKIHSTQDRAWTFLALGKTIKKNAGKSPEIEVLVDGKLVTTYQDGHSKGYLEGLEGIDLMGKTVTLRPLPGVKGKAWYSWRIDGIRSGGGVKTKDRDNSLKVRRSYYTPEGQKYLQPLYRQGELVICKLELTSSKDVDNVAVMDLIPAGFEIENMRLSRGSFAWVKGLSSSQHLDARDDRAIYYTSLTAHRKQTFTYLCRVVNQGTFLLPPLGAEAMYDPGINSYVSGDTVRVYDSEAKMPESRLGPLPASSDGNSNSSGGAGSRDGLWTQIRNQIQL